MRLSLRSLPRDRCLALGVALTAVLVLVPAAGAAVMQVSTDPFTRATCTASATTNHHTEVEPDFFLERLTIVAAYQVGRIYDGGACAIGFAHRPTMAAPGPRPAAGNHQVEPGGGTNDRATDAAVAYDAKHNVWLISSLVLSEAGGVQGDAIYTSRSTDGGLTWGTPVIDGDRQRSRQELDRLRQYGDEPILRQLLHRVG